MEPAFSISEIRKSGQKIREILDTPYHPVGVRFGFDDDFPSDTIRLERHRYCQALMHAREGASVLLTGTELACPAAAAAFGFKELPDNLQNGKGLVGFGIVSDQEVGKKMFSEMFRFPAGQMRYVHLFPLVDSPCIPDVILMEDATEKLMWVALAELHRQGGKRLISTTAVLQATCVDCTILPYIEKRMNLSYGCYGCREATNLASGEAALGFPISFLPKIMVHLNFLNSKAIPRSRSKKPFSELNNRMLEIQSYENS